MPPNGSISISPSRRSVRHQVSQEAMGWHRDLCFSERSSSCRSLIQPVIYGIYSRSGIRSAPGPHGAPPGHSGQEPVGIYLHGSLTQRAFNPKRSDVDCIVVTRRGLSDAQLRRLGAWLSRAAEVNQWAARLQMLFLLRNEVLTMNSKACLYQFGLLKRSDSDGNPIIWMNILQSGVVLFGPSPESFVPVITPEMLFQALEREVGYLREEISGKPQSQWRDVPSYRAYAVLTLCRILYSFRKGTIVSKQRAAKWAIKYLPGNGAGSSFKRWRAMTPSDLQTFHCFASSSSSISPMTNSMPFRRICVAGRIQDGGHLNPGVSRLHETNRRSNLVCGG